MTLCTSVFKTADIGESHPHKWLGSNIVTNEQSTFWFCSLKWQGGWESSWSSKPQAWHHSQQNFHMLLNNSLGIKDWAPKSGTGLGTYLKGRCALWFWRVRWAIQEDFIGCLLKLSTEGFFCFCFWYDSHSPAGIENKGQLAIEPGDQRWETGQAVIPRAPSPVLSCHTNCYWWIGE